MLEKNENIKQEQEKKYDEICGVTYVNIFTLTKNEQSIVISPFNPKNSEHLFILHVAKGVAAVTGKTVYVKTNRFQLWKLNRKINKDCRFKKLNKKNIDKAIEPDKLINFMKKFAKGLCGEDFNFGQIYEAFFNTKKRKEK